MKYTSEEVALVIIIKDETGKEIEQHYESRKGKFPYWDESTQLRVKNRLKELNN